MVALPVAFAFWLGCDSMDADDNGEKMEKKTFSLPRGPLALLGVLGFFAAMSASR